MIDDRGTNAETPESFGFALAGSWCCGDDFRGCLTLMLKSLRAMSHILSLNFQIATPLDKTIPGLQDESTYSSETISLSPSVAGFYWLRHTLSIDCDRAYESNDLMELALNVASLQRIKLQKPNPVLEYYYTRVLSSIRVFSYP